MKSLLGSLFKSLSFVLFLMPTPFRAWLGIGIGFLWFDVFRIRRDVAIANLGIAFPEKSVAERTRIARRSLHHMGRTIIEYAILPFLTRDNVSQYVSIEGESNLQDALKNGKGAILLTLHLGNGDFGISALSKLGYPMNLISKEFKARWLNDLWFGMRRKIGTKFISVEKSSFDILRALRKNEFVIFVLDQFMGPPIGVRTLFFGKETGTAAGCALIAERTKTPVLPCYTYRLPNGQHQIVIGLPIQHLDHQPGDKNIAVMTQDYTDRIESIVRGHPDQWMWIHRRWKEFRD
jgi:KDO2-lipid IV(A) lauroyltransferase